MITLKLDSIDLKEKKKCSLFYQTIEAKSTLNLTRSYFKNVCLQMRSDGNVQGSQSVKIRQGHIQGRQSSVQD